jgi:N-acetylglucosaminyldiphosphoundecaprenol N-acetyl-beta-D-mannosaminyltransferase
MQSLNCEGAKSHNRLLRMDAPISACANVLGVAISAINMEQAILACDGLIAGKGRGYVSVTGVHGIMEAQSDPAFRAILNHSFLCVPDGMPTVWVGRLQGHGNMRRVYGPDFMLEFCSHSVARNYRHFLYGGKQGVARELAAELRQRFTGLQIVGTYTPPFRPLTADEGREIATMLKACKPDVIWIGLSTPKQERFMAEYLDRLDAKLMIGVGAAFDVHTGHMKDAPAWVKAAGLQWLHRLLQEPRRLWKRYLINNPAFLLNIALQFGRIKRYPIPEDSKYPETAEG